MESILFEGLNSNIFFGFLTILTAIAFLAQFWWNNHIYWPSNGEYGRWTPSLIVLVVVSTILAVVGCFLLIDGILYETA